MRRGDYGRVLAEFWADGPNSETPPGHWNTITNRVADHPDFVKRFGGTGPVVEDLEWDVKVYFALDAAVQDAACATWSVKRRYDDGRPIQAVRCFHGVVTREGVGSTRALIHARRSRPDLPGPGSTP